MSSKQQKRITIIMPSASPTGGAEEAFCQLLRSQAASRIKWQTIFLESGPLVEQLLSFTDESFVVSCGRTRQFWKWWHATTEIVRHCKRFRSDLILGWMTKGHVYGGLAAWRSKVSASWFQMGNPEHNILDQMARMLPSQFVFACSEFVAREQRAQQPTTRVVPIPLGVDLCRFDLNRSLSTLDARRKLSLPLERKIIGIVGRLQSWKGMHTLIHAMPAVLLAHPDTLCLIVGGPYSAEPNYEMQLRKQAADLGIAESVRFVGMQSNVPLWMQSMDVVVHASEKEPFGIVVVEAMSLGKSVIAATPGGPDEIIRDGVDGFLTQSNDFRMLAFRINQLLSDPLLRECMGKEAYLRASTDFSSEAFAKRLCDELDKDTK